MHRVFRAHQRVQRATALSFRLGRGSYALSGCIRYSCVYIARMSPTLSGSSALQRVKLGDALEIRNGIIFDFYSGLPHFIVKTSKKRGRPGSFHHVNEIRLLDNIFQLPDWMPFLVHVSCAVDTIEGVALQLIHPDYVRTLLVQLPDRRIHHSQTHSSAQECPKHM